VPLFVEAVERGADGGRDLEKGKTRKKEATAKTRGVRRKVPIARCNRKEQTGIIGGGKQKELSGLNYVAATSGPAGRGTADQESEKKSGNLPEGGF